MIYQDLASYKTPQWYSVGSSKFKLALWSCFGSFFLSHRHLPGSGWRIQLLRLFGSSIGPGCYIKPGFRVKFPWKLSIGEHTHLGEDVWIDNVVHVSIGDRVCISQSAYLCTGNHDYSHSSFSLIASPIALLDDVWICAKAVISPGVTIGRGSVVSLGAVVQSSVDDLQVVSGNPAVYIRSRKLSDSDGDF